MYAIISDIHSNLEALTAVLQDIKEQGIDTVFCLGDIVGYGPQPIECTDRIEEECTVVLRGNHDQALFTGASDFNRIAEQALDLTREILKPGLFSSARKKRRWAFLRDLPTIYEDGDFLFVHASPRDHVREYLLRTDMLLAPEKIVENLKRIRRVCFVGHTHQPGIFTQDLRFLVPAEIDHEFRLRKDEKVIVNVGSVGQPRDNDNRACYVVVDGETIRYRRIAYDFRETQRKIKSLRQLHELCAERLAVGK